MRKTGMVLAVFLLLAGCVSGPTAPEVTICERVILVSEMSADSLAILKSQCLEEPKLGQMRR